MRVTLILLMMIVSMGAFSQIPTIGLQGYYPFCGNANDMSGNGNHLTVNNATLTTDRFGKPLSAYSFNGINSILYNNNLYPLGTDYTFSCWFLANSVQDGLLVYNGNSNSNGVGIVYDDGAAIPGTKGTMLAGGVCFCMGKPASLNQWHHIVLLKQPAKFKLYIDNVLVDSSITNINPAIGKFHIGQDYTDGTNPFDGKIDDVAIYNRALTTSEISQLYTYQCSATPVIISPAFSTIGTNGTTSFSVPLNPAAISYQWQQNNGSGFTTLTNTPPFSGVTTNTLMITNATTSLSNTTFRCIINDISCCSDTTTAATLFVTTTTANCFTIQNLPDTLDVCKNGTVQLNPTLSGLGTYTTVDTTWSPSTGLSNPNIINPLVTAGSTSRAFMFSR